MLEGWEWIIIGVVAIVIIMWGPAKIPEFAKSLGRAKGEFLKRRKNSLPLQQKPLQLTTNASCCRSKTCTNNKNQG